MRPPYHNFCTTLQGLQILTISLYKESLRPLHHITVKFFSGLLGFRLVRTLMWQAVYGCPLQQSFCFENPALAYMYIYTLFCKKKACPTREYIAQWLGEYTYMYVHTHGFLIDHHESYLPDTEAKNKWFKQLTTICRVYAWSVLEAQLPYKRWNGNAYVCDSVASSLPLA